MFVFPFFFLSINLGCLESSIGPLLPPTQPSFNQVLPLQALPTRDGQFRVHTPFLGALTQATLTESRKCPLHWVSTLLIQWPQYQPSLHTLSPFIPAIPYLIPPAPTPAPSPPLKSILFSLPWEIYPPHFHPPEPSSLPNLSGSTDYSLISFT